MKAIFSFCTKFCDTHSVHGGFPDAETFDCSCILSVQLAKQQFSKVILYTDARGAQFFERLQLSFDEVHLIFDEFAYPHQLWMTSKLQTYRLQTEPFVHLDLDAYLWGQLPAKLLTAPIIAQSSEEGYECYDRVVAYFLHNAGYMPDFVQDHATKYGCKVRALNAGIYGGHDIAAIHACCDAAFTTINHPANQRMFAYLGAHHQEWGGLFYDFNILLEQYFSSVYFHQYELEVGYLLAESAVPCFTHLLSSAKRHPTNVRNLKARVAHDYPDYYQLAQQIVA